jgi:hypothetical protein
LDQRSEILKISEAINFGKTRLKGIKTDERDGRKNNKEGERDQGEKARKEGYQEKNIRGGGEKDPR